MPMVEALVDLFEQYDFKGRMKQVWPLGRTFGSNQSDIRAA